MSAFNETNNSNVLNTESSAIESLSSNLYNAIKNNMNTSSLFTEQAGGAGRKKKAGSKKLGSKKGSKRVAARAGSKIGSKKAGSKKGSKRVVARPGSKKGSKKAGSKKGSKRVAARPGSKKGSKKSSSKGSKRAHKVTDIEMMGGRRKKGGKKSSKSSRSKNNSKSLNQNIMSDSIDSFLSNSNVQQTNATQDGGKNKKGSNSKRQLPEKLQEFQRLVKHLSGSLTGGPVLMKLAKAIRNEVSKAKPNISVKELTNDSIKHFDANKTKWTAEYNKLKAEKAKK